MFSILPQAQSSTLMPIHSMIHQGIITTVAFQHFISMNTQTRMKKIFRSTNIATTPTKMQEIVSTLCVAWWPKTTTWRFLGRTQKTASSPLRRLAGQEHCLTVSS